MTKKWKIAACAALAILVLLLGTAYLSVSDPFFRRKVFVSDVWRTSNERGRGQMVNDLVESRFMVGKTKKELLTVLGNPDTVSDNNVSYTVDIGHRFGFSPWYYSVTIIFDEAGLVQQYYLHD